MYLFLEIHSSINSIFHGFCGQDLWKGSTDGSGSLTWLQADGGVKGCGWHSWQLAGLLSSHPLVWSLHLSESGLPHSMAAWSIKSEHLTQQQGNHPAFYELVLEVS